MTSTHAVSTQSLGSDIRNDLLRALPPDEFARIEPHLERLPYEFGHVVHDVLVPIEWNYFPETAVVSSLSVMADGSAVETATIGREGMSGIAVFHGVEAVPEHAFVQVPGEGLRIPSSVLLTLLPDMPVLTRQLHRYATALFTLVAQNSGCNRKHSMVQRCARWILLCHDRVGRDEFSITHHVLSQMLGVRRASVTEAAIVLGDAGAIEYTRGVVRIVDRARLEESACECYGIIAGAFARLLGGEAPPNPLAGVHFSEDGHTIAKDGAPAEPERPDEG